MPDNTGAVEKRLVTVIRGGESLCEDGTGIIELSRGTSVVRLSIISTACGARILPNLCSCCPIGESTFAVEGGEVRREVNISHIEKFCINASASR